MPPDLLTIDLSSVYPDLKYRRLRGRLEGTARRALSRRAARSTSRPSPLNGLEIAWVDDPIELFFLHIQGSGQIELENGERMRVGYADQNGHPVPLARPAAHPSAARSRRSTPRCRASRTGRGAIRARCSSFLNANPSYVFFRELPSDLPGPIGSLGVPLTAERSIAVDARVVPLGVPVYLATTWPDSAAAARTA